MRALRLLGRPPEPGIGPRFARTRWRAMTTERLCAKAGQQFFVWLRPEPRHVRNGDPAVLDRYALAIRHVSEIAEETLERALFLLRGEDVQGREIAGAEIGRMRHAGRTVGFRAPADVPLCGQPILHRARLQIVDAGRGKPREFERAGRG